MISAYNVKKQEVLNKEALTFINRILTGSTVTHDEDSSVFSLNKPGYYYVTFNGISDSKEGITIQLYNGNKAVPGAVASTTSSSEENIAFSTIIKVAPSCCCANNKAKLTFVNDSYDATLVNANVVITKLC